MIVQCDSSYADGVAGIGVVVMDFTIMVARYQKKIKCSTSVEAEAAGIAYAIEIAKEHGSGVIEADCRAAIKKADWNGEIKWVPRRKLRIANSLGWMARQGIDVEKEYAVGRKLGVDICDYPPGNYMVGHEVVTRKDGWLLCTCMDKKVSSPKEKFYICRHIVAVKLALGEITPRGENVR